MNTLIVFFGLALVAVGHARPHEDVHHVTGELITHVYKFKEDTSSSSTVIISSTSQTEVETVNPQPHRRPVDGHRIPIGSGPGSSGGNGIGLKTNCQKGFVAGTDKGLQHGISGVVNNAEGVISDVTMHGKLLGPVGGAVDHVGHAAQGLLDNVDNGLGEGIDDVACGVGKMADELAVGIDTGNLVGGVVSAVGTAAKSVEHTLSNVVGGAAKGVSDVLDQAVDIIADL